MQSFFKINLFGTPGVTFGQEPSSDFPADKVKQLFFYLALFHHTAHPREVLLGTFWGDWPETRARRSLSTAIWRLRRWLEPFQRGMPPYILIEDGQVAFNLHSHFWLDILEFEQRVNQSRVLERTAPAHAVAILHQAIDIYSGELMRGCYADWCLAERDRLHQLYLDACARVMTYHSQHGDYAQAIVFATRILHHDPLREEIQRELIKLYGYNRQPAQALAQYSEYKTLLDRELGVDPMPETINAFTQILTGNGLGKRPSYPAGESVRQPANELRESIARIESTLRQLEAIRGELGGLLESITRISQSMSS